MIKAVLYLRSSKDRADMSIDAQRRQLQELAQQRDILIVGEFSDAVESGKDDDRPAFQNLLREMRNKSRGWDCVLALDTARIARRRHISIIFEEHECKRNNIRVIYKSLPESDPITEMLLKSILQAMDEWHSLTSKVKGLAGMSENVKQGYRAGGIAPKGYKLEHINTDTIREGVAVTKSKLTPSDDALLIKAYLQSRARGLSRRESLSAINRDWPITSMLGIERNALTYAGHTVWNRHAERQQGGYVGGEKYRPRSEWVIQKNTHEALITEEDAEIILDLVKAKEAPKRKGKQTYLFAGLVKSPDGTNWRGDDGSYRLGKGKRISASIFETAILNQVKEDLQGDEFAQALLDYYKSLSKAQNSVKDIQAIKTKISTIEKQIDRLADLISETDKPAPLIRKIESLETDLDSHKERLEIELQSQKENRVYKAVGIKEIKNTLNNVLAEIDSESEDLKNALTQFIGQIILSDDATQATINYKVTAQSGLELASPRGFEPRSPP